MRPTRITPMFLVILAILVAPGGAQDAELAAEGKAVYASRCVICHGADGDGKGLTGIIHRVQQKGVVINVLPRDFTAGMFKFRTTPSGYLPTDADLMRTVKDGIARSGMPGHNDLTEHQRRAVVEYIKTFSPRWQSDGPGEPIEIGEPPAFLAKPESVDRGREMWTKAQCHQCHGETGRGDGPAAPSLMDSWGDKIEPFDFTSGPLKGGSSPRDIFKTFVTGLDGTPMPSYQDALPDDADRWDLVSYCLHLMEGGA